MSGEPSPVRMRTIAAHSGAAYEAGQLGHRNGAAPEGTQVLNARDPDRLADTAADIVQTYGVHVNYAACDVTDGDGVRQMVGEAEEQAPIDILVNNAGIHIPSSFVD